MCVFTQPVKDVSSTRIYARHEGGRQHLVYEMRVAAAQDLAMILPLPTRASDEQQLRFVDLSGYARFFGDMKRCFPVETSRNFDLMGDAVAAGPVLAVHQVGAFEASFVPKLADFTRLDMRFRLPDDVWRQLPAYDDYGFAVFQLCAGETKVHPMAFTFATRHPDTLFFPTAHVHDGSVHPTAHFDHELYAQDVAADSQWIEGKVLPRETMDFGNFLVADRTRGLVRPDAPMLRCTLKGEFANEDIQVVVAKK